METKGDLNVLPENCIAHVISLTTPRDACVSSLVSSNFRSAADSDIVWECFLPSDYASLLSRTVLPVQYASKRELYLRLCEHPVQIDGGKLIFGLEKTTGAKCFAIPARELNLHVSEHTRRWEFIPFHDSRFFEAAKLTYVYGEFANLIFHYRIMSKLLSSDTTYASYLIFKLTTPPCWKTTNIIHSNVTIDGSNKCQTRLFLRPPFTPSERYKYNFRYRKQDIGIKWPKLRIDECLEIEIGEFYNENWEDREIEISSTISAGSLGQGTVILGIELRPKVKRSLPRM